MRLLFVLSILLLSACTASPAVQPSPEVTSAVTVPQIIAPANESEFVESTVWLEWDWPVLANGQLFVLRLWYGEETPQELWTADKRINAQGLIDSYSQEFGDYHWQVAVVNTTAEGAFDSMASEWTAIQNLHRVRHLSLQALPLEQMSATARFIAEQNFSSKTELIEFTRAWMVENTLIGEELSIYQPDYSDAAEMMYQHSLGAGEAPQMYCNGISTTLLTVLRELGIDSRLVFLYGEIPGWISEHTVLEVFNPDSQLWEVQDGTNNAYYVDTNTGERVSIARMVFGNLDTIQACTSEGCGNQEILERISERLGAFRYGYSTEMWVNPDRFNIARRIEAFENANFPEFIAKEAGVAVQDMIFHFDSWQ